MQNTQLNVLFILNMCTIDVTQMPEHNGMIVVPCFPEGSWYGICSSEDVATLVESDLKGEVIEYHQQFPVLEFVGGIEHSKQQLRDTLEKAGFEVTFLNEPPWL